MVVLFFRPSNPLTIIDIALKRIISFFIKNLITIHQEHNMNAMNTRVEHILNNSF